MFDDETLNSRDDLPPLTAAEERMLATLKRLNLIFPDDPEEFRRRWCEKLRQYEERARTADTTGDAAILAKFADWCTTEDAYSAALLVDPDDTHLGNQADEIATEILQLPATGSVGLAVKTYLTLFRDGGSLPDPETTSIGADALIRDLIRFAPILEPRCRAYLAPLDAAKPERDPAA
jgi:hypothetical protein